MELGNKLPPVLRGRISLDRDVESAFPIDVAREIVGQSFLLIVRRSLRQTAHLSDCHRGSRRSLASGDDSGTAGYDRTFQQIAGFTDSSLSELSHACESPITGGTDYAFIPFPGAGVLWVS